MYENKIDKVIDTYRDELTYVTQSEIDTMDNYTIGALHVLVVRAPDLNHYWSLLFDVNPTLTAPVCYGIYVDTDHLPGMGATYDPRGNLMTAQSLYRPEYVLYVDRSLENAPETYFFTWDRAPTCGDRPRDWSTRAVKPCTS